MSHVIRISDTNMEKMRSIATVFEDSENDVIERALDFYISQNGRSGSRNTSESQVLIQNPDSPDDLRHTKVRRGRFGNIKIRGRNWSELVRAAHEVLAEKTDSFDSLRKATPFNVLDRELEERGYHFFPKAGVSVQYRSAPDVWEGCLQIARSLNLPIEVEFEWLSKEKATHPGEKGKLSWDPAQSR